jgi:paraquat-inducible protein B
MASNIVPGNIDGTYPVAGQDNSSQGFRDNFNAIKNNFTEAKTEIELLQTNKANLNATNDFSGNLITDAELKDNSETVYAHGSIDGNITLNHENGHYQTLTTTGTITLGFLNLPVTGKLGRIILDVTVASTSHTITIPSNVLVSGNVSGGDGSSDTITVPTSGRYLYEFMSPDGGTTILMHQLGNNYI